jgi:hypothetical protein
MHPQLIALVAAEHVKDMRAQTTVARRVREARRARRGSAALLAAISRPASAPVSCATGPVPALR